MVKKVIDMLIGEPLANEKSSHEKFNVPFGLAIMASDAVSSVAYAAEEILRVLIPVIGVLAYAWLGKVSLMIIGLLIILTISYMQVINAYPQGGGAYIVAKENIGEKAGLFAGAALSVDYILTVAVSASAGIAAITSIYHSLYQHRILLVVLLILILTILNLRGVSESAKIFSVPTYIFIISMLIMIIYGLIKYLVFGVPENYLVNPNIVKEHLETSGVLSIFLILKAFSSGCSALTGIEAVSNSVPNFKSPGQKNAKIVMSFLAIIILFIFGGSSLLAYFYHAVPLENPTVISQLAYGVFGNTFMFYLIQFSTAIILMMACNTAFTGFPTLMYVMAKDGYSPRQFIIRGQRLSFSTGIITLTAIATILVVSFKAKTSALIPLYSVGVFLSFTLSQIGMVIHWKRSSEKSWKRRALINGFGAILTFITTIIISYEKFPEGAWVVIILIPLIVAIMLSIKKHYNYVANSLRISDKEILEFEINKEFTHHIIIPVASLTKATLSALQYARSLTPNVIAIHIGTDEEVIKKLKERWQLLNTDIILIAKYSPYRAVVTPLLKYIEDIIKAAGETERVTILLPEFITHEWWGEILHNHTSFFLRESMLRSKNVTISTYPYHIKPNS